MAFDEVELTALRSFLGWPDRYLETDSALQRGLEAIQARSETEAEVRRLLGQAEAVWDRIVGDGESGDDAEPGVFVRLQATKVGSIELDGAAELDRLRSIGRQVVGRIASLIGIEVRHDVWTGSGPAHRSSHFGPLGGGGEIPFGG